MQHTIIRQVELFLFVFLGELKTTKKHFEITWPLESRFLEFGLIFTHSYDKNDDFCLLFGSPLWRIWPHFQSAMMKNEIAQKWFPICVSTISDNLSERKALNWHDHAKVTNKTRYSMWKIRKNTCFLEIFWTSSGYKKVNKDHQSLMDV